MLKGSYLDFRGSRGEIREDRARTTREQPRDIRCRERTGLRHPQCRGNQGEISLRASLGKLRG
jgi:hypothetical protein